MLSYEYFSNLFSLVEKATSILILNAKPDGDSIGSSLALNKILSKMNKNVSSISFFPIPDYLDMLATRGVIKVLPKEDTDISKFDLIILVDASDLDRIIDIKSTRLHPQVKTVCIDHHANIHTPKVDLCFCDTAAESTCGLITDIFIEYKQSYSKDVLDKDIAFLLYAGIVADTDYFGYANVTSDTFERAAYLMQYKFDPTPIIVQFREMLSLPAFTFIQKHLPRVIINENKRFAYLKIKKGDLGPEDNILTVNEAVNYINRALIRIIDKVDFCFVLREIHISKCSLALRRHNNGNTTPLHILAEKFGGGGHPQSAGAQINSNIDTVEKQLIEYINEIVK
jgi:bifunctional oligoribonuclease and PAP phosphatase NrnA